MKPDLRRTILFLILLVVPLILAGFALSQQEKPITKEQLVNALRQLRRGDAQGAVINTIRRRGVDFELTATVETELRAAGARQALLAAVRNSFRPSQAAPITTPTPLPTERPQRITNHAGIELVWIPPGSFRMGSTNGEADEKPVHQVTISYSFYVGKYEVTQAQWRSVMGSEPSNFKDCGNCPVEQVSWNDAHDFINKLNRENDGFKYRLPSEAEWEYSCRAGTTDDYSGYLREMAWYSENSGNKTHGVGGKQPNAWDLADMHGNVFEWCQDWYHDTYDGAPTDGGAWLSGGTQKYRVLRGGSWKQAAAGLHSANRAWGTSDARGDYVGFRVVAVRSPR